MKRIVGEPGEHGGNSLGDGAFQLEASDALHDVGVVNGLRLGDTLVAYSLRARQIIRAEIQAVYGGEEPAFFTINGTLRASYSRVLYCKRSLGAIEHRCRR